jgi:hypothetical protein
LGSIGFNYFYFFFAFNLISGICYIAFYPETKGRTLEQMDALFRDERAVSSLEYSDKAAEIAAKDSQTMAHVENT